MRKLKFTFKKYFISKKYLILILFFSIISCLDISNHKINSNKKIYSNLNSSNILNNINEQEGEYDTIDSDSDMLEDNFEKDIIEDQKEGENTEEIIKENSDLSSKFNYFPNFSFIKRNWKYLLGGYLIFSSYFTFKYYQQSLISINNSKIDNLDVNKNILEYPLLNNQNQKTLSSDLISIFQQLPHNKMNDDFVDYKSTYEKDINEINKNNDTLFHHDQLDISDPNCEENLHSTIQEKKRNLNYLNNYQNDVIITGTISKDNKSYPMAAKIDPYNNNVKWTKIFNDMKTLNIIETSDKNFMLTGTIEKENKTNNMVIKMDKNGQIIFAQTFNL